MLDTSIHALTCCKLIYLQLISTGRVETKLLLLFYILCSVLLLEIFHPCHIKIDLQHSFKLCILNSNVIIIFRETQEAQSVFVLVSQWWMPYRFDVLHIFMNVNVGCVGKSVDFKSLLGYFNTAPSLFPCQHASFSCYWKPWMLFS